MFTASFTKRKPDPGFHSAVEIKFVDSKNVVNFQSPTDVHEFELMLHDHAQKKNVLLMADDGNFHVTSQDAYNLGLFVDSVFDSMDDAFQGWEVTRCRLWKHRLESTKGGSIYFIGDPKDEESWFRQNIRLLK